MADGTPFESEGRDYLRTLRVVEACYVSAAEGRVVNLDRDGVESGSVRDPRIEGENVLVV
jgi:hypothetical protein